MSRTAPVGRIRAWMWAGASACTVVLLGGLGYWGWTNRIANDEASRKLAEVAATSQRSVAEAAAAEARRVAAEEAAERAEIAAAQAALKKRIAEEEAQARARAGIK